MQVKIAIVLAVLEAKIHVSVTCTLLPSSCGCGLECTIATMRVVCVIRLSNAVRGTVSLCAVIWWNE